MAVFVRAYTFCSCQCKSKSIQHIWQVFLPSKSADWCRLTKWVSVLWLSASGQLMSKTSLKELKPTTICRPDRIFIMGVIWLYRPPTGCQGFDFSCRSGNMKKKPWKNTHVHWATLLSYEGNSDLPMFAKLLTFAWGQVHRKSALIQTHNLLNTPQAFLPSELLGFSNLTPFLKALTFRCGDFKQDSWEALWLQCWAHMASCLTLCGIRAMQI